MPETLEETENFTSFNAGDTAALVRFIYKHDGQTKIDPAIVPNITITDSAGTAMVTAQATTKNDTGEYFYEYAIPAAGPAGVWLATWEYDTTKAVSEGAFTEYTNFFVEIPSQYNAGEDLT